MFEEGESNERFIRLNLYRKKENEREAAKEPD